MKICIYLGLKVKSLIQDYQTMRTVARKILFEREISLTEAANHCGVSIPFISMVLSGRKRPSLKVRQGLSQLLKIPQEKLFPNCTEE